MTTIYTLAHPVTKEIRYIGKTLRSLDKRLQSHIDSCKVKNNKRNAWIKSVLKLGLKPTIEEIDSCESFEEGNILEISYISLFKSWGFRLVNATIGGDGPDGHKHSEESKKKMSDSRKGKYTGSDNPFYGKAHSQASKDKISIANAGRKSSLEFKERRRQHQIESGWRPSNSMVLRMKEVKCVKVSQFDLFDNLIANFASIKEAAEATNSIPDKISRCLSGKRRRHNGFIWKKI